MNHASAAVQSAFVVYEIGKIGYHLYKRYHADWYKAQKIVAAADVEIKSVMDEVENGIDLEVQHIADAISSQTMDVIENNTTKRRVRAKAPFRAFLVKAGKAKFGLPNVTDGNRMCIRKYLYDICVSHGVIARHIAENVDFATEMVFIPTAWEMRNAAMSDTKTVRTKARVMKHLGATRLDA
jgi:hypothetical protein